MRSFVRARDWRMRRWLMPIIQPKSVSRIPPLRDSDIFISSSSFLRPPSRLQHPPILLPKKLPQRLIDNPPMRYSYIVPPSFNRYQPQILGRNQRLKVLYVGYVRDRLICCSLWCVISIISQGREPGERKVGEVK